MTSNDQMTGNSNLIDDEIVAQAVAWHLRVESGDMASDDWAEFNAWLAGNALHAEAYNQAVEADADLIAATQSGAFERENNAANDEPAPTRRRFVTGSAAIAAAVIAGFLFWPSQSPQTFTSYATAIGETRSLAVADGIRIEMNGATEIAVADTGQPLVRLEEGEVAFYVRNQPPGAVRVEVGALTLVDNGTIFNVIRHDGWIRVGVAEGTIIANPENEAIQLTSGQTLRLLEGSGMIERGEAEPQDVIAWQDGQLVYTDTPASVIATDLSRNLGTSVSVDEEIALRRLTGTIQLGANENVVVANAAALLDGDVQQTENGWMIVGH